MDYLLELRKRLITCFTFTLLVFAVGCFFANPLYRLLAKPLLKGLFIHHLISTELTAVFLIPLKCVFFLTLFLLIPLFLYHLWSFIAPALYKKEKKIIWLLLISSVILFYAGVGVGYQLVLPLLCQFFIKTVPAYVLLLPDIAGYLTFVLQTLLIMGLVFEIPVLVMVLVYFNILTVQELSKKRRYIIVLSFGVGMIVTPDVLSQTLIAITMWVLFELGLVFARFKLNTTSLTRQAK